MIGTTDGGRSEIFDYEKIEIDSLDRKNYLELRVMYFIPLDGILCRAIIYKHPLLAL